MHEHVLLSAVFVNEESALIRLPNYGEFLDAVKYIH